MENPLNQKLTKDTKKRWLKIIPIVFLVLFLVILAGMAVATERIYANRIYPNIFVGDLNLGGLSKPQAAKVLEAKTNQLLQQGFEFTADNKMATIQADIVYPNNLDLAREIKVINFDNSKTIDKAYSISRNKNFLFDFLKRLTLFFGPEIIPAQFKLDDKEVLAILKDNFSSLENPAQNANLAAKENSPLKFEIEPAKLGAVFDYNEALDNFKKSLFNLKNDRVSLALVTQYPQIKEDEAALVIPQAEEVVKLAPLTLIYGDKSWQIDNKTLAGWLAIAKNKSVFLSLDKEKIDESLKKITDEINIEAKDAKFKILGGKVLEFQQSSSGEKVNFDQTFENLEEKIFKEKKNEIEIVVDIIEARNDIGGINDLGIAKLIGAGESNFKGSPKNRRYNIKVGNDTLNGVLIKPAEEFSLIQTLGPIEAETGYLPELVIKENKTIPEYGGGLCQIGTTMFRAALNTGLPITERRNHSYRVFYYEPAGMDATIYNPKPDLRFINDTGHYILLQTKIDGDRLVFEMWGTPDGRKVEISSPPRIFNITKPQPTKIIETDELAPGEKKCTETSHNGADAEFTRKVTYSDGKVIDEVWSSHYRPWQAVCLVGKAKEETSPQAGDGNQSILPNTENPVASTTP